MTRSTVAKKDEQVSELQLSPETLKTFASMATMIPEAEGSAYDSILSSIFNVTSWDQLDDPWDTTKTEGLMGVEMRIDQITRRNSSYKGGLGLFLVVHAHDVTRERSLVWTTGSVAMIGQLVVAYARGWFPLYAELVVAAEPTDNGYYPQHLKILGSGAK
jgi:hypothetical protein